ncbi:MAG: hypothetical protein RBU37_18385 [Myxococcota bacterium]|nr:hypothetical protein [Myxococcota bacterium]
MLLETFNPTNERHVAPNPQAALHRLECRHHQCYLHLDNPSEACQRAFEGLFILAVARLEANQGSLTTLPADDHIELHIFFTFPRQ